MCLAGFPTPCRCVLCYTGHFFGVNSLWCLDDFTPTVGCTRVVPTSHRSGRMPPAPGEGLEEGQVEELVTAKAGEVRA